MKKRILSFKYAIQGVVYLLKTQPNSRIHLLAAIAVVLLAYGLEVSNAEWGVLMLAIGSVIAAETFNTSIEALTDLVSPEHHRLAGIAKDTAAGAVLLTAMGAAAAGLIIFVPKLLLIF